MYIYFFMFLIISIVGCSNNNTYNINRNAGNSAEQIIRDHCRWINEKNIPKINETLTNSNALYVLGNSIEYCLIFLEKTERV